MSTESKLERLSNNPWSILNGRFIPASAFYRGRLKTIEDRVNEEWKDDEAAPRILVADVVQEAVEISQPELFTDAELRKTVAKDIGTSVFACYSYSEKDLEVVEEQVKSEINLDNEQIPVLETLEALLEGSEISLPSGHKLERVCRACVFHILLKQRGRRKELPPPRYN